LCSFLYNRGMRAARGRSEIRIPANLQNIWDHEIITARALSKAGYTVEFLAAANTKDAKSPDILMDGELWEMKAPKTDKLSAIERNLKRATRQSSNIIIDSHRLRKIHDQTVQHFLIKKFRQQRTISKLVFINRKREVIDISQLA